MLHSKEKSKELLEEWREYKRTGKGGEPSLANCDFVGMDLSGLDLSWADLSWADLFEADLSGANLDYSCWPLWCGTRGVKVDTRIAMQLAAHFCALDCDDEEYLKAKASILDFAEGSHRAEDLGLLKED